MTMKEKLKNRLKQDKSSLVAGLLAAMALNFLFFIYGTLEMYFLNKADLLFGMVQVLKVVVPLFLMGFALAGAVFFVLWITNEKIYIGGLISYFIAYLATYIQGTFLLGDLPIMNGTPYEWSDYAMGRVKTIAAWVIVAIIIIVAYKFLKKEKFFFMVKILSVCMTLMLLVTGVTLCIQTESYKSEEIITTFDREFEVSSNKNFIILMLDSVNTEVANEVIEENPKYQELFTDFTYYRNMLGAYPNTLYAVSYLFSGDWYENDEDLNEYRRRVFDESQLFDKLEAMDYTMGLYTGEIPHYKELTEQFVNVVNLERTVTNYWGAAGCMIKLSGFRYGMFDLKQFFNINIYECYNYFTPSEHVPYTLSNEWLYKKLQAEDFQMVDENWFKFIHVDGAHVPWELNEDLVNIGQSDYKTMVKVSLNVVEAYINELKQSGAYDNSVIIVMADHGVNSGVEKDDCYRHQMPFFCVKGIGEEHEFKISDAPISFEDMQTAFLRLLDGSSGEEIFDWDENDERERRFIFYTYGDDDYMMEYVQTGHVFEVEKFVPTGNVYERKTILE